MTLLEQAVDLLGTSDPAIKQAIQRAMHNTARQRSYRRKPLQVTRTKAAKAAARRVADALRKLQIALASEDLAYDVKLGFPLDEIDFQRWHARAEEAANTKLNTNNPNRPDAAKEYAAEQAKRLLEKCDLPVTLTRKGKFCTLAAIIYGDRRTEFLHHCRVIMSRPEPGLI